MKEAFSFRGAILERVFCLMVGVLFLCCQFLGGAIKLLNNVTDLSLKKINPMPLDIGINRPQEFSYFCNFDALPGVVACAMEENPSLVDSCYFDISKELNKLE